MSLDDVKALTFDTGGTILDWHTGFSTALAETGVKYGVEKDWAALTNELRRRSLKRMLNLGEHEPPTYNFDDGHRAALDEILDENGLDAVTAEDRRKIWWDKAHSFQCWPDFPGTLPKLREKFICASFTILSFPHHHRYRQAQRAQLGRRHIVRGDRQVQDPARSLPDRRQVPATRARPMLHGGVSQLRPRRRQGGRLQDRLRAPSRRVGSRRTARSHPQPAPRPGGRRFPGNGAQVGRRELTAGSRRHRFDGACGAAP